MDIKDATRHSSLNQSARTRHRDRGREKKAKHVIWVKKKKKKRDDNNVNCRPNNTVSDSHLDEDVRRVFGVFHQAEVSPGLDD